MDAATHRALLDKVYEKRKNAALDLERTVREAAAVDDVKKLHHIIAQLCELAASPHSNARSGAIMGLAGVSIALGPNIAEYLGAIVPPVLACFSDTDSKVRYFACESMYNVAKVAKGEILIFFNELFDAMSKLAADTELPVKNGAELLDRLIKDIVTEQASTYVSTARLPSSPPSPRASTSASLLGTTAFEKPFAPGPERVFSLERFIPLLRERIYVLNPFTRAYLVSWLTTLDSVPELELVSFLPDFLDGLLKFLGDPTVDIRTATQNLLADFLREIREVAEVKKGREEEWKRREEEGEDEKRHSRRPSQLSAVEREMEGDVTGLAEEDDDLRTEEGEEGELDDGGDEGSGEWIPGQGVSVDHAAIVEILLVHLSFPDEEIQSTCLRWIAEFLLFCQPTMVPLTPRLLPVILSSLAHHVASIRTAANETNYNLYKVIQDLTVEPLPPYNPSFIPHATSHPNLSVKAQGKSIDPSSHVMRDRTVTASPPPSAIPFPTLSGAANSRSSIDRGSSGIPIPVNNNKNSNDPNGGVSALSSQFETVLGSTSEDYPSRPGSSGGQQDGSPFDFGATVNALTLQFLSEHEETRVAALEWLLMLHQKAPERILAVDEGAGDATRNPSRLRSHYEGSESGLGIALLLKLLSDPSEKVLSFMMSLFSLFSTDRRLLETRGSLIIRQLCLSLNTERIYRTFAEILERDEDLEFASIMVQNLNLIMITSPELSDFRKRLKTLESKDGQTLFTILYRSWSHNAVATFSLCLLAQAYEQACALLQIFADLEITVSLLIQIDKLVQLLESPVFTYLRLQLLEPDRYPFLLKAMYGLLMLLPQSSAFATLRNRLSAVSSLGFLNTVPKAYTATTAASAARSAIRRPDDIRWTELLTHFRQVQKRRSSASATLGGGDGIDPVAPGQSNFPPAANAATRGGPGPGGSRRKPGPSIGRTDSASSSFLPRTTTSNGWRAPGTVSAIIQRPGSPAPKRRLASAPTAKKSDGLSR